MVLPGAFCGAGILTAAANCSCAPERRTYLISTLLGFALGAELLSLLLFVQTAESLSSQFIGAMCATGVLNINHFGFPLLLKIAVFFSGGSLAFIELGR